MKNDVKSAPLGNDMLCLIRLLYLIRMLCIQEKCQAKGDILSDAN